MNVNSTVAGSRAGLLQPLDRHYVFENFVPGKWLDRRQVTASTFTAIVGTYERSVAIVGGLYCQDMHYFDMRLALRAPSSRGRLTDHYVDAQPLGDVIFVPAGHRYVGEGGPGVQRNFFLFLNANANGNADSNIDDLAAVPARPRDCMNLRNERIKMLLTQICREMYDPGFASELLLEGLGITLQAETLRLLHHDRQWERDRGGLSPVHMRLIRERVLEGDGLPSLAEIAATCNLSQRHLMRAFRQETGQTVGEFVQQLAMDKARQLLRYTDQPVMTIATAIGFASPSAFATAFRRVTGESPRAYRSSQRALSAVITGSPS